MPRLVINSANSSGICAEAFKVAESMYLTAIIQKAEAVL